MFTWRYFLRNVAIHILVTIVNQMIKERMINVTKIQPTKLSILLRFYFHDFLAQLKTNIHTNFRFERVLGFVIDSLCTDAPLHSVKTEKRRLSPRFFLIRTEGGGEGRGGVCTQAM